jgi:hypothetical protein
LTCIAAASSSLSRIPLPSGGNCSSAFVAPHPVTEKLIYADNNIPEVGTFGLFSPSDPSIQNIIKCQTKRLHMFGTNLMQMIFFDMKLKQRGRAQSNESNSSS